MASRNPQCLAIELPSPTAEVVRISRNNARVKEGTKCLWFVRDDGVQFVGTGKIESVLQPNEEDSYGPVLEISHEEKFKAPRTLDEMAGSLARLKEPLKARRSFAGQYVRLDFWDYQRIRVRYVDRDRTIFRTLFFALPEALRLEFLQDSLDTFIPGTFPVIERYEPLAERLLSYLRGPVANVLTMAAFLHDLHEEADVNGLPGLEALALANPVGEHPIGLGRASLRLQRERGRLLPDWAVRRETTHDVRDGWSDQENGLILGLPENVSTLAPALPDDTLDGSAGIIDRLTNRRWHESIL